MNPGAVARAQSMLGVKQADGRWGRFTQAAYAAADPAVRAKVDTFLANSGTSAAAEFESRKALKTASRTSDGSDSVSDGWISVVDANRIVSSLASRMGVGQYSVALQDFLHRESVRKDVPGVGPSYLITSRNGSSRGLMQMQPAAWTDAQKTAPEIGDYSNVLDPWKNIAAGLAYAKRNIRTISKYRPDLTINGDVLYLAHKALDSSPMER